MELTRYSKVTQQQMDDLASLASIRLSGSYTFDSSSVSASLWLTEMNRIHTDVFNTIYNGFNILTQSMYSRKYDSLLTMEEMPAFQPRKLGVVSGPWLVSNNPTLTDGTNGWNYSDVDYYYTGTNVATTMKASASFNQTLQLRNEEDSFFIYPVTPYTTCFTSTCRIRIGGDQTGKLLFRSSSLSGGGLRITVERYSGSVVFGDITFAVTTDIPGATIRYNTPSFNQTAFIDCNDIDIDPGVYYCQASVTANQGWGMKDLGIWSIGSSTAMAMQLTNNLSASATTVPGISKTDSIKKIVSSHITGSTTNQWPWGIYCCSQDQINFYIDTTKFLDVRDGVWFNSSSFLSLGGNPNNFFQKLLISANTYTVSPTPPSGSFSAKTLPPNKHNINFLELIPYTKSGSGVSAYPDEAVTYNGNVIQPACPNVNCQWPANNITHSGLQFVNYNGMCVHDIFAVRTPNNNGSNIQMSNYSGSPDINIQIGYDSGSGYNIIDTINIPPGSGSIQKKVFWPVFSPTELTYSSSLNGSGHVQLDVNYMTPWIGVQAGVSNPQDLRVPWLSGYTNPISSHMYQDLYNILYSMTSSI